jgi:hypothetical protein
MIFIRPPDSGALSLTKSLLELKGKWTRFKKGVEHPHERIFEFKNA